MNIQKALNIYNFAQEVRKDLHILTPVDVQETYRRLGGNFMVAQSANESDVGVVEKAATGFRVVLPNRGDCPPLYALGHLLLHTPYLDEGKWRDLPLGAVYKDSHKYRYGYLVEEHEANCFYMFFLAPKEEFEKLVQPNTKNNIIEMGKASRHFNMSVNHAMRRLEWFRRGI